MKRFLLAASALALLPALASAQPYDQRDRAYDRGDRPGHSTPQRSAPAYRSAPAQPYTPRDRQSLTPTYRYQAQPQRQYAPTQRYEGERARAMPQSRSPDEWRGRQAPMVQPYGRGDDAQGYRGREWNNERQWNRDQWNHGQWREGWWRGHRGFEDYDGPRFGFWFAPGWGYYSVDPYWANYDWAIGSFVPDQFWSYAVADPWDYGLPPAPWGTRWIFLGDQIVLIDLRTGSIIQIAGGY